MRRRLSVVKEDIQSLLTVELQKCISTSRSWDEALLDFNDISRQYSTEDCHSIYDLVDWLRYQQSKNTLRDVRQRLLLGSNFRLKRLNCGKFRRPYAARRQVLYRRRSVELPYQQIHSRAFTEVSERENEAEDIKTEIDRCQGNPEQICRLLGFDLADVETLRSLRNLSVQLSVWTHQYFEANKPRQERAGNPCPIRYISYLGIDKPLGPRYFATCGDDGFVKIFETETAILSMSLKRHFWSISCPLVGPIPLKDGEYLLISGCMLGNIRLWIMKAEVEGASSWRPSTVIHVDGGVVSLEVFETVAGGRHILVAISEKGHIICFDLDRLINFCEPKSNGGMGAPPGSVCGDRYGHLSSVRCRFPNDTYAVCRANVARLTQKELSYDAIRLGITINIDEGLASTVAPDRPGARRNESDVPDVDNDSESLRLTSRMRKTYRRNGILYESADQISYLTANADDTILSRLPKCASVNENRWEIRWGNGGTQKSIKFELAMDLDMSEGEVTGFRDLSHYRPNDLTSIATHQHFDYEGNLLVTGDDLIIDCWSVQRPGKKWSGPTPLRLLLAKTLENAVADTPTRSRRRSSELATSSDAASQIVPSQILNRFRSKANRNAAKQQQNALSKRNIPKYVTQISAQTLNCNKDSLMIAECVYTDSRRMKNATKLFTRSTGVSFISAENGRVEGTLFYEDKYAYRSIITVLISHPYLPSVAVIGDHLGYIAVADIQAGFLLWGVQCPGAEWSCAAWHPSGVEFVAGQLHGTFSVFSVFKGTLSPYPIHPSTTPSAPEVFMVDSDESNSAFGRTDSARRSITCVGTPASSPPASSRSLLPANPRFAATPLIQFMNLDFTPVVEVSPLTNAGGLQERARRHVGGEGRFYGSLYDHHFSRQPHQIYRELRVVTNNRQSFIQLEIPPAPFQGFYARVPVATLASPLLMPLLSSARAASDPILVTESGILSICVPLPRHRPYLYPQFVTAPLGGPALTDPQPDQANLIAPPNAEEPVDIDWEGSDSSSEHSSASISSSSNSGADDDDESDEVHQLDSPESPASLPEQHRTRSNRGVGGRNARARGLMVLESMEEEDDDLDEDSSDSSEEETDEEELAEDDTDQTQTEESPEVVHRQLSHSSSSEAASSNGVDEEEAWTRGTLMEFIEQMKQLDDVDFDSLPFEPFPIPEEDVDALNILERMAFLMLSATFKITGDAQIVKVAEMFAPSVSEVSVDSTDGLSELAGAFSCWSEQIGFAHLHTAQWQEALQTLHALSLSEISTSSSQGGSPRAPHPSPPESPHVCVICNKKGYRIRAQVNRVVLEAFSDSRRRNKLIQLIEGKMRNRRITRRIVQKQTSLLLNLLTQYLQSLTTSNAAVSEVVSGVTGDLYLRHEEREMEIIGPFVPSAAATRTQTQCHFYLHRCCFRGLQPRNPVALRGGLLQPFSATDLERLLRVRKGAGRFRAARRNSLGVGTEQNGRRSSIVATVPDALCIVCGDDFAYSRCLFCTSAFHPSCALRTAKASPPIKSLRPARVLGGQEFIGKTNSIVCNTCVRRHYWPLLTHGGNAAVIQEGNGSREEMLNRIQLGDIVRIPAKANLSSQLWFEGVCDALVVDMQWRYGAFEFNQAAAHNAMSEIASSMPLSFYVRRGLDQDAPKRRLLAQLMAHMTPKLIAEVIISTQEVTCTMIILPPHQRAGEILMYTCKDGLIDSSKMCILTAVIEESMYVQSHVIPREVRTKLDTLQRKGYDTMGRYRSVLVDHNTVESFLPVPTLLPVVVFDEICRGSLELPPSPDFQSRLSSQANSDWKLRGESLLIYLRAVGVLMVHPTQTAKMHQCFGNVPDILGEDLTTAELADLFIKAALKEEGPPPQLVRLWEELVKSFEEYAPFYGAFLLGVPLSQRSILSRLEDDAGSSRAGRGNRVTDLPPVPNQEPWVDAYGTEIAQRVALLDLYKSLKEGHYRDELQLRAEFDMLVSNALYFNGEGDDISRRAEILKQNFFKFAARPASILPSYSVRFRDRIGHLYLYGSSALESILFHIGGLQNTTEIRTIFELSCQVSAERIVMTVPQDHLPKRIRSLGPAESDSESDDDESILLPRTRRRRGR